MTPLLNLIGADTRKCVKCGTGQFTLLINRIPPATFVPFGLTLVSFSYFLQYSSTFSLSLQVIDFGLKRLPGIAGEEFLHVRISLRDCTRRCSGVTVSSRRDLPPYAIVAPYGVCQLVWSFMIPPTRRTSPPAEQRWTVLNSNYCNRFWIPIRLASTRT